jgi:thiol-disulfide isomerase/thioredoxin
MTKRIAQRLAWGTAVAAASLLLEGISEAAPPTPEQALQLAPIQKDVDFDRPEKAEIARCKVEPESARGGGWIIRSEAGEMLRRFVDSNADNKIDQWCYYKHSIEVYRDIDVNFNGLADQYRWLGTAGTRWGLDANEDGKIEAWKAISAEEVTAELVAALRDKDLPRFEALLLSTAELKDLGLNETQQNEVGEKIEKAAAGFAALARQQRVITTKSHWLNFGGNQPGVLAAGSNGATKDVVVYDNVAAVIETDGKTAQFPVGAIIKVDSGWRLIDLPALNDEVAAGIGYFFRAPPPKPIDTEVPSEQGLSPEIQKLITELEKIDKDLAQANSPAQQSRLNTARADIMEQLAAKASNAEERTNWLHQTADTISAAVQGGSYPEGIDRLKSFLDKLEKDQAPVNDRAYVKFRWMTASYTQSLQSEKADYVKIQETWLKDLEAFLADFPGCDDAPEAMLQLAITMEFAGKEVDATKWFDEIVRKFPEHELAKKAAGASFRINSVGKVLNLKGKTTDGRSFDIASLKNKVVLVHYWSTWCEPCKADMEQLKTLQAKYARQGFALVGVSLDSDTKALADFLRTKKLTWPQLYEPGGLESPLANELGILTLPTMLLIDKQGKVISRSISIGELDTELGKQLR